MLEENILEYVKSRINRSDIYKKCNINNINHLFGFSLNNEDIEMIPIIILPSLEFYLNGIIEKGIKYEPLHTKTLDKLTEMFINEFQLGNVYVKYVINNEEKSYGSIQSFMNKYNICIDDISYSELKTVNSNIHNLNEQKYLNECIKYTEIPEPEYYPMLDGSNNISWDDYFMGVAILSSYRSKDPSTKVGACIVNPNTKRVISMGYNGMPNGCSDSDFPWTKTSDNESETKYPYVVHAELNAILNAKTSVDGCYMYVTLSPCPECTKAIIQSGIKKIIYKNEYKKDSEMNKASKKMIQYTGIISEQYKPIGKLIVIDL